MLLLVFSPLSEFFFAVHVTCILQFVASAASRLHFQAEDFCRLIPWWLCVDVCSCGAAGRSSLFLLVAPESIFWHCTFHLHCFLFSLPLGSTPCFSHSARSISSTLKQTLSGWEMISEFLNTIIDFTLILFMNQEKLLCRAVIAKKPLTSCLKTTAWKQPDRSTSLFSLFLRIFFKHTVSSLTSIIHPEGRNTKVIAFYLQQRSLPLGLLLQQVWISCPEPFPSFPSVAHGQNRMTASASANTTSEASVLGHRTCKRASDYFI